MKVWSLALENYLLFCHLICFCRVTFPTHSCRNGEGNELCNNSKPTMKTPLATLFCYLEWDKKKEGTKYSISVQSAPIQNFQAKEMLFGKIILKQSRLLNFTGSCEQGFCFRLVGLTFPSHYFPANCAKFCSCLLAAKSWYQSPALINRKLYTELRGFTHFAKQRNWQRYLLIWENNYGNSYINIPFTEIFTLWLYWKCSVLLLAKRCKAWGVSGEQPSAASIQHFWDLTTEFFKGWKEQI